MKSAPSPMPRRLKTLQRLVWSIALLLTSTLFTTPVSAKHNSDHPLSDEDWEQVMEKIALLDDAVYIPSLLPIIMRNRDALQLTEKQLERLYSWRKNHYVEMVNIMNRVIEKKVQFSVESLSSTTSEAHLLEFQKEIHHLQHELLKIRLSCRAILVETFTDEQWENFEFIVADDPKLASLFSQAQRVSQLHHH